MIGLSLPVDIPWKRIATSDDLVVKAPFDGTLPRRWRSSLTVFEHQPGPEYQTFDDQVVTYLKVAASITGFQPDSNEVGIKNRSVRASWRDSTIISDYEKTVGAYYPCYGAILEVVITPGGASPEALPLSSYPYISDFEPKKRELYELVTDTGETLSRTLESVGVHKGSTTSDGSERVDSLNFSAGISGGIESSDGKNLQGSAGMQSGHSTKNISGEEFANVRNVQSDREMRESFAHTTQLTQMYHQLNSYHLGTNRVMFYMLPRPHVVQTEKTFVNGPRLMEGVQEFFLVVMRPKKIEKICVDASLETAHISQNFSLAFEQSSSLVELHLFQPTPVIDKTASDDSTRVPMSGATSYMPPDGWEIDVDRKAPALPPAVGTTSGYRLEARSELNSKNVRINVSRESITLAGTVEGVFDDKAVNRSSEGRLNLLVTAFIRKRQATLASEDQTLYLTGRTVSSCPNGNVPASDYIAWEGPIRNDTGRKPGLPDSLLDANRLRDDIGFTLRDSLDSPNRFDPGTIRFVDTQLVANTIGRRVGLDKHIDNVPVVDIKGIAAGILKKLARPPGSPPLTRVGLLAMPLAEQMATFGLSLPEAQVLRRTLLGASRTATK